MPTSLAPDIKEGDFQTQVTSMARMLGWKTYHTYRSTRSDPGFPDLVCVHPRLGLVFLELKTRTGKVKPEQFEWNQALVTSGERAYIVRPEHIEQLEGLFKGERQVLTGCRE